MGVRGGRSTGGPDLGGVRVRHRGGALPDLELAWLQRARGVAYQLQGGALGRCLPVDATVGLEETSVIRSKYEIVHDPSRCGGRPTVGETRITVDGIIRRLRHYESAAEFLKDEAGHLTKWHVLAALDYYLRNQAEIDGIIAAEEKAWTERALMAFTDNVDE